MSSSKHYIWMGAALSGLVSVGLGMFGVHVDILGIFVVLFGVILKNVVR